MSRLNDRRSNVFNATQMTAVDYLQTLCAEAAELFGNDWAAVSRHISEGLAALRDSDRDKLLADIGRIVRLHVPDTGAGRTLQ